LGNVVRVEIINLGQLTAILAQRWRDLQAATPDFMSPLLGPDFAILIAKYRPDAKLAVGYMDEQAVAFFPFHPTSSGYARAIGAPFCDYQAIVSDPAASISGADFVGKAGIASLWCSSLSDPHGLFDQTTMTPVEAYRIDCTETGTAYMHLLRQANSKWTKNVRRLRSKMEREMGAISLVGHDTSKTSFDTIMAVKIRQLYKTGLTNVFRPRWVKAFMQELFEMRSGVFGGCLVSLYAGDKLVAGQFGVRYGDWYHPWIVSSVPEYHSLAPGILCLSEMIGAADELGFRIIDLASDHGHYKSHFCPVPYLAYGGIVGHRPETAPGQDQGPLGLIERRLDLISTVEPDFAGRVSAIGAAVRALPRRLLARKAASK
jgi:CelD/BcsL family acetyltransferase involved in cellulose biosynthesis